MATVIPRRGKAQETAQLLLELADHPRQVQTTTEQGGDMGVAFVIPDELHDKYLAATKSDTGSGADEGVAAVKRRPGRPRKAAAGSEE